MLNLVNLYENALLAGHHRSEKYPMLQKTAQKTTGQPADGRAHRRPRRYHAAP